MNYCIKYATKTPLTLSLDKCGNTYRVTIWDEKAHAMELIEEFDSYEHAELCFMALVKTGEFNDPVDVNHDSSDFANID